MPHDFLHKICFFGHSDVAQTTFITLNTEFWIISKQKPVSQKAEDQAASGEDLDWFRVRNMIQRAVDQERQPEERILITSQFGLWVIRNYDTNLLYVLI